MADMGKVRGWLRQRERADGMIWLWCYQRERPSDGKIVENAVKLGPVADIGDETAAWIRVGELGLKAKVFPECSAWPAGIWDAGKSLHRARSPVQQAQR
jgi:hypothetical protein